MRLVSVAVPVPGLGPLTYSVPDDTPAPPVGARVLVPLGKRVVTGVVLPEPESREPTAESREPKADSREPRADSWKPLTDVLDAEPFLPSGIVSLAAWVADYYAC